MKLISVNIGQQETLDTPNGQVQTGIIKKSVSTKVVVTELGLEGDAIVDASVHGGLDQALTPNMEIVQKALASPLGHYHKNIIQGLYNKNTN
ncbi:MAG: hypothetical protein Q7T48_03745 [Cellvibrio sp.]|uniref:hypothetical protein n=1 Tax=Cellvibrio sp. TaxID=1965322 RepID=UPI0027270EE3|nr:hypothetical protein [Cellvibrio sp.]